MRWTSNGTFIINIPFSGPSLASNITCSFVLPGIEMIYYAVAGEKARFSSLNAEIDMD